MCFYLPPLGYSACSRSEALAIALVFSPAALRFFPVLRLVHFPSLGGLVHCGSPVRLVLGRPPAKSARVLPHFVRPLILTVPLPPRLLESVPSPAAECRRPVEPVLSPVAPDPTLVRVFPMARLIPPPQPPPPWWFPDGSFVQNPLVPVLAFAPLFLLACAAPTPLLLVPLRR